MQDKNDELDKVLNFCRIQLAIVYSREQALRKELLDCKIQKEFLTETIASLGANSDKKT